MADRPYLEAPIGPEEEIVEHTVFFDNIFPSRTGTVTALGVDELSFVDNTLDFDINDQLTGTPAKVSFVSGQLASFEFEITEYVHATRTITIKRIDDDPAYPDGVPNPPLVFAVGDKYVLLDINMPASYVTDAESRLLAAGQSYLDENKVDRHEYTAELTPLWVLQNEPNLRLGYTINIKDAELGIDKDLRIAGWQRDLQQPAKYTGLKLTERIKPSEIARQYAQQERILYAIQTAGLLDPDQMRKNLFLNRLSERDGYLYLGPDKAKAGYADLSGRAYNADVADYALDSDKWDGMQFADYMNQPVRSGDSPRFAGTGSPLFVSGFSGSGWNIVNENDNVSATFDKLTVRKEMNVYELIINQIRATNGSVWISDAIKINGVTQIGSNYFCEIDSDNGTIAVPFVVDDIIRCQRWTGRNVKYYVARIISTSSFSFTLTMLDGGGFPEPGDDVVRMGNVTNTSRRGALYLTASDDNAPYIDVIDGVTSASLDGKTKVRMGKLDGIVDPDMGALTGYGLYAQNAYITGKIQVTAGSNVPTREESELAIQVMADNAVAQSTTYTNSQISFVTGQLNGIIDYAETVAQSKADIAQAAAISAASADAQAKANAARNAAEQTAMDFAEGKSWAGGKMLYRDPDFRTGLNDIIRYNNAGNNNVTVDRVASSASPTTSGQVIRIRNTGSASPGIGGFYFGNVSRANARFITRIIAMIPQGRTITWSSNASGTGRTQQWITPNEGTGNWEEYIHIHQCGTSGTFSTTSYFYISGLPGTPSVPVDWFVAYATVFDVTDAELNFKALIDDADAKAQTAQTAYNNLTAQLKGMAYKDIVQLADMGTTVISGGKLVTTLIDANYIRSNVINAGYINTLALDASVITSGTINSARINASQIISNGNGATTTYAQQQASAAQSAAIAAAATDATTKANNALALARSFTEDKVSLVKNPAVTGDISGWSGPGLAVASVSFNGLSTPVLRCTTSGDSQILSDWFDVDPAKIYEVTLWMYAPTAGGNKYFGLYATSTAGGTSNNIAVEPITNTGSLESDTTNGYFITLSTTIASWRKMTAYILPSGFLPADAAGIGLNITRHYRMQPTTKRILLRWLNYSNSGTSRSVYVAHPTVTEISSQTLAFSQTVKSAAATADSKAVAAQNAHNALTAALKDMAYKDVVALADLNSTIISGGKIVTTLLDVAWIRANVITAGSIKAVDIDVANLFAQSITATNLTVTGSSKVGGFNVSGNKLVNSAVDTSLIFNNLSSAPNTFLRMNESSSSPIVHIRTDQVSRRALNIETYASAAIGLSIINNASGGSGRAIQSSGGHEFFQRAGEYWSAPGALLAATVTVAGAFVDAWHINAITPSISSISSSV
ncbi:hypothetical protein CLV26_1221, partial [Parapedobacter indicus]